MKIAIIGLGTVGSAVATAVYNTGLVNELVLFDRNEMRSRAAAEDLGHASTFGFDVKITAVSDYKQIKDSEIVIIAAGANQKPGQTRTDLLQANANTIRDIVPQVMANVDTERVKLIVVTNPLDVMVMLAMNISGLPSNRVIGTGTMLDSARFKTILSRKLGVSTSSINSYVLGEHGDSAVLNWSATTVGTLELEDFCHQAKISMSDANKKTIEHRVHNAAYEIIQGRGATWDGIGAVVSDLVRCIVRDEKRILTISKTDGVNEKAVAVSLPRIVGRAGVLMTMRPKMSSAELKKLKQSAIIIRENYDKLL